MYTQCPECGVAFRVTAEILKQAAGKVRCGGCGHAFNALEHLSEEKPAAPVSAEPDPAPKLPELTPDQSPELEAGTPPKSISAEESAALLKTLDQLAGEDIRIEDTGVEWRVLNDDEEEPGEADAGGEAPEDEAAVEKMLEQSFKPIDQVITESGAESVTAERVEEMRFDDNTPLPDDFDFDSAPATPLEAPSAAEAEPEPEIEHVEGQADLAFGDPDEWQDLLGDIQGPATAAVAEEQQDSAAEDEAAVDAAEEPPAVEEADAGQLPDTDTQFALQAEAMGIDLSGMHAQAEFEETPPEETPPEEVPVEDDKRETTIEEDLIAAAFEKEAAERELRAEEAAAEAAASPDDAEPAAEAEPAQEQEQEEEPQEIAARDQEAEVSEPEEPADTVVDDETHEPESDEESAAADDEAEPAVRFEDLAALDAELEELVEEPAAEETSQPADADAAEEIETLGDIELELEEELDEIERKGDVDEIAAVFDDDVEAMIETVSPPGEPDTSEPVAGDDEHAVPEMTEEEKTINMMIDQELFNIAVEDEDGFASTIVQLQPNKDVEEESAASAADKEKADEKAEADKKPAQSRAPLVETIIMEGESVLAESADDDETGRFDKPAVSLPLPQEPDDYARRGEVVQSKRGMIVGIVVLILLLALQAVHQSREALATLPFFSQAAGPIYRMIGKPLTPTWDISGWRFEATKGSTDENDEQLTIYSRVGNNSDTDLPYPLVHVSLTDRFEDIIGSRVLEPSEYLAENADPRKLVPPGNTFNAVISIAAPAPEATGFKLNVCYRLAGGQLRCALEDFK